jgi:hypothetical protein
MANDITTAISGIVINNKRAVCSTLPTGKSSKLLIRPNYPVNLTIANIQNKFDHRFDDPSYYYGGAVAPSG